MRPPARPSCTRGRLRARTSSRARAVAPLLSRISTRIHLRFHTSSPSRTPTTRSRRTTTGVRTGSPRGSSAALTGTARGVPSVDLQEQDAGGSWKTTATLKPRGGAVAPKVKPDQSSKFRLVVGTIASDPVPVAVAPSVRLHIPPALTGFWGTVKPAALTATVTVQRQAGTAWRPVVQLKTTPQGRFTVGRTVPPGTYRVRVAAKGFAPGFSKPVTVS